MATINRRQFLKFSALSAASALVMPEFIFGMDNNATNVVVPTSFGKVRGLESKGVCIFKGIPYGGRVSGNRRFLTPNPVEPWTGIRDCIRLGSPSIQGANSTYGIDEPAPDEECLVLNIWTPATDNRKRAVMFYSHGGGYSAGSAGSVAQDGTNLARRYDVVVVATNHRLGLLGYLYLDQIAGNEYAGSGNRGVQDIALALKWVHENIAQFGGDPYNVMIFGESGGGLKTSCLYAMPEAAPYFNKASIESGPGVLMKTTDEAAITTELVLNELQIKSGDWAKLIDLPVNQLLEAQSKVQSFDTKGLRGGFNGIGSVGKYGFGPVVDGITLPNHPFEPGAPDISRNKPLMVGWNEDEYIFFAMFGDDKSIFHLTNQNLIEKLKIDFGNNWETILETYQQAHPNFTPTETYMAIRSIILMGLGSVKIAEQKARQNGAPVYLYNFGYKSELKIEGTNYEYGAMHALDIPFKFDNVEATKDKWGNVSTGMAGNRAERVQAASNMAKYWTSFARTGVPADQALPVWEPFNLLTHPTMRIDSLCGVICNRFQPEIEMWRRLELNQF